MPNPLASNQRLRLSEAPDLVFPLMLATTSNELCERVRGNWGGPHRLDHFPLVFTCGSADWLSVDTSSFS